MFAGPTSDKESLNISVGGARIYIVLNVQVIHTL